MNINAETQKRLQSYLRDIGEILKYPKRKAAFATYVVGLFGVVERKTAESIASLSVHCPEQIDAEHQRLLHVIGQSKWDDQKVRRHAVNYAVEEATKAGAVESWIVDDTGWLKKGKHSVGVQRQYTGSSGKVDNCQLGVSLVATTAHWQVPINFDLYLPESWTDDIERRQQAKVPDSIKFKTKEEIALAMINRAIEDQLPLPSIVLADSFYGRSGVFRSAIRKHGLHYGVGVRKNLKVRRVDKDGIRRGPSTTVSAIAKRVGYRRVLWADGSAGKQSSYFSFVRVVPTSDIEENPNAESVWLVIEKTDENDGCKFSLCSLPKRTTHRELVRLLHQRWRTERVYQDMKQEFGLAQYQGRSYLGWHHHVTASMVCYAFAAAEQARLFPPRPDRLATSRTALFGSPSAALRRVHPDDTTRDALHHHNLVLELPFMQAAAGKTKQRHLRQNVTQ